MSDDEPEAPRNIEVLGEDDEETQAPGLCVPFNG
jgi:hypothetical protein